MGQVLWEPSKSKINSTQMYEFLCLVKEKFDGDIFDYKDLHKWSVTNPDKFWPLLFSFFKVEYSGELLPPYKDLLFDEYSWFSNINLNFAQNLLNKGEESQTALNFVHESGYKKEISYSDLRDEVSKFQNPLSKIINEGDVLAAYMPNIPETVISMLACTSLGGVFTSTSADFGIEGVVDRFGQSKPKVLVAACGYEYNGKYFDLLDKIAEIENRLPFIEKIILVDFLNKKPDISKVKNGILWNEFLDKEKSSLEFRDVPFNSPLYIMYSSGTTGKPKCIVHSVGGTLLQHVKELGLHVDLRKGENLFYFTTCGWMMWNWLVSGLYFGSSVTLFEGSPGKPSPIDFFKIIENEKLHYFGTSPKFLKVLEDLGYDKNFDFPNLKSILSTGAPLLPEQFEFIYKNIKEDINVSSICGGTDILGCFMLGNPILPVRKGEIQCLGLGMDVASFSESGEPLIGSEGELVCQKSFPSRPLKFLDDPNDTKFKNAYFEKFENIWHHGDFITITEDGGVEVFGRSDATLNPGGVRIGTAEIYRQTEQVSFLEDSLCVGKLRDGEVEVVLFVNLKKNEELTDSRIEEIKKLIKKNTTPRHVPKEIHEVSGIPYTRSGKKMELAITRIINNKKLTNIEAVSNPECLEEYNKYI